MTAMNDITVVSFDVWKTLIKVSPHYKPIRIDVLRSRLGLPIGITASVAAAVSIIDNQLNAKADVTGTQYGTRERLELIAQRFGTMPTEAWVSGTTTVLRSHFRANPPLANEPGLPQTLRRIRESGRRIVLISNTGFTDGSHVRIGLEALGIWQYVEHGFFSDEVGVAKPSPEIFRLVINRTGVPASAIMHVGDNIQADYQGATRAGLQARLLSSRLHPMVAPGQIVSSIAELVL